MRIDDVRAFAWIAASGSLSRTARDRSLPKATLSHRLRRLEKDVGAVLLIRSGSGLVRQPKLDEPSLSTRKMLSLPTLGRWMRSLGNDPPKASG